MAFSRIKSLFDSGIKSITISPVDSANLEPEIGLRIIHSPNEKTLRVMVLGARHLPQKFGLTRVNSYVVKLKLFPLKEKFETTFKNESWPVWNEEFTIHLRKETKVTFGKSKVTETDIDGSKLVIATLYAILEDKPLIATEKKKEKKDSKTKEASTSSEAQTSKSSKFINQILGKKSQEKEEEEVVSGRKTFDKRRTIGATTIPLDPKNFVTKPPRSRHPTDVSTGDVWKPLKPIASGIAGSEKMRESAKGQVEIILTQEKSNKKDVSEGRLVLCLSRFKCTVQTMHQHEALKGQLYIKMSLIENGNVTNFWKSDRFQPTISIKFAEGQSQVIADNHYEGALHNASFVIKMVSKNKMGKKTAIGHLVLGPSDEEWKQAMAKPGQPVTKWIAFE